MTHCSQNVQQVVSWYISNTVEIFEQSINSDIELLNKLQEKVQKKKKGGQNINYAKI
jgi:hypothetical protein